MSSPLQSTENSFSKNLLDVLIRAALIAILVTACFQIFHPFLGMMIWSLILAVTLYPLHTLIKRKLINHDGYVASLIVVLSIIVLLIPVYFLGSSLTDSAHLAIATVKSGSLNIPAPPESVANIPFIGAKLFALWQQASSDLTGIIQNLLPHIKSSLLTLLSELTSVSISILVFIGSLVISGVIMAYAEEGYQSALRISARIISPEQSTSFLALCTATIRSVAQGVIGVAFIQMIVIAIGLIVMGIPGAGILSMLALLVGIMQLPLLLVLLPIILFAFFIHGATVATIIFAIYMVLAGLLDNILKPIFFGRGASVPMPIVLIGALGGMLASGIVGLFIGPVILSIGYTLFWQWVNTNQTNEYKDVSKDAS